MAHSSLKMPDGLSLETALFAESMEDEYDWLQIKFPGFQLIEQSVQNHNGRTYDVMLLELPAGGQSTIYFDITDFAEDAPDLFSDDGV